MRRHAHQQRNHRHYQRHTHHINIRNNSNKYKSVNKSYYVFGEHGKATSKQCLNISHIFMFSGTEIFL